MKKLGIILCIVGLVFCFAETYYFGWNILPGSGSELICDIIGILLTSVGISFYLSSKHKDDIFPI